MHDTLIKTLFWGEGGCVTLWSVERVTVLARINTKLCKTTKKKGNTFKHFNPNAEVQQHKLQAALDRLPHSISLLPVIHTDLFKIKSAPEAHLNMYLDYLQSSLYKGKAAGIYEAGVHQ